MVTFF